MRKALLIALTAIIAGCATEVTDYTSYVDPFIGTGGHGHVFVGANVPFGAVQLGPTSVPVAWDWCSGYHSSDSSVVGFSHTHLSGTGIGDLFDITVMPVNTRDLEYTREGIAVTVDRKTEKCVPGDTLYIGGAYSSYIECKAWNPSIPITEGQELQLSIGMRLLISSMPRSHQRRRSIRSVSSSSKRRRIGFAGFPATIV